MLINKDDFIGLLNLDIGSDTTYLDAVIEQAEEDLLNKWFTYSLVKDILADTPSTEAQALIDGFEYTDTSGVLKKITGLKDLLVYFDYFYIVRDKQVFDSSVGMQEALAENSTATNPARQMTTEYNKGVKLINTMFTWLSGEQEDYPEAVISSNLETINIFGI